MTGKRLGWIAIIVVFAILLTFVAGALSSKLLQTENFTLSQGGLVICQLSDLHYPKNGVKIEKILEKVTNISPDLIFLCGDMADDKANEGDVTFLGEFYRELTSIAPCFCVIGNHEIGSPHYDLYREICAESGVILLINEFKTVDIKGEKLMITGLNDGNLLSEKNVPQIHKITSFNGKKILIAHRPELFYNYAGKVDYVFSGHAHGGQFRFLNIGIYAPNQGFFPKYTSGKYVAEGTTMFLSRGLGGGNPRLFNRYHIIVATI